MISKKDKNQDRLARHQRVRKKISGTPARPRLNVYRSTKHINVQLIDDETGVTLAGANSTEPALRAELAGKNKTEQAYLVGKLAGERALEKGLKQVVFDRGGYIYTGRVASVAAGAREAGLDF